MQTTQVKAATCAGPSTAAPALATQQGAPSGRRLAPAAGFMCRSASCAASAGAQRDVERELWPRPRAASSAGPERQYGVSYGRSHSGARLPGSARAVRASARAAHDSRAALRRGFAASCFIAEP